MSAVNTIVEQFNVLEDLRSYLVLVFGNYGGERSFLSELKKLSAAALS